MIRLFLLSAALGFALVTSVSACRLGGNCGSSASSGTFSVGSPTNFAEPPPNITGGTLVVDLGAGRAVLTYPDGESFVEFTVPGADAGGQGGAN